MRTTLYRIYDHTDQHTLASGIPTLAVAERTLKFLQQEYPSNEIEIETYTTARG